MATEDHLDAAYVRVHDAGEMYPPHHRVRAVSLCRARSLAFGSDLVSSENRCLRRDSSPVVTKSGHRRPLRAFGHLLDRRAAAWNSQPPWWSTSVCFALPESLSSSTSMAM